MSCLFVLHEQGLRLPKAYRRAGTRERIVHRGSHARAIWPRGGEKVGSLRIRARLNYFLTSLCLVPSPEHVLAGVGRRCGLACAAQALGFARACFGV